MQQEFDELKVSDAYSFCLRRGDHVRRRPWFSEAAKEQALQRITVEKLREVHAKFLRECFATIVICGNMSHAAAADVSKLALQALGMARACCGHTSTPQKTCRKTVQKLQESELHFGTVSFRQIQMASLHKPELLLAMCSQPCRK